jgi:hypothetical protein
LIAIFLIIKKPPIKSVQAYHNTYNEPQQQHWKVDIEDSLSMEHIERTSQMQETGVWGNTQRAQRSKFYN